MIFYAWFNFDAGTFLFEVLWLAAGIVVGAVKTKGFREKPAVIQELWLVSTSALQRCC